MLKEIYAENFALIEKLHQSFGEGLTVLSGETGAGKSVLIDAVGLLLGDRFDQDYIRSGAEKCAVEGVFSAPFPPAALQILAEAGLEAAEDEDIVLSREGNRSGKSSARINFRTVPLTLLRELAAVLINIHGQAEHTLLCQESKQTDILDAFGGEELRERKRQVAANWQQYKQAQTEYEELQASIRAAAEKEDFLRYQIKELRAAALRPGEDEELRLEANKLERGEQLLACAHEAKEMLSGGSGVLEKLDAVMHDIRRIAAVDPTLGEYAEKASSLYYEAEDMAEVIGDYAAGIDIDPAHIEDIQQRLATLERLKKKYRTDIDGLIAYRESCERELENIDCADSLLAQKQQAKESCYESYMQEAAKLGGLREQAAAALSAQITEQLQELYMPNAQFKAELIPVPPAAGGLEKVSFQLAANSGEPFASLSKTASGGELSRVILAIKVVLSDADGIPTLIFDEIDTGLGGRAVSAVSKKLSLLSAGQQVLCVTHAPILAAAADHQVYIYKEAAGERTVIRAQELSGEARVQELCRMLAGDAVTPQTVAQAREMLKR